MSILFAQPCVFGVLSTDAEKGHSVALLVLKERGEKLIRRERRSSGGNKERMENSDRNKERGSAREIEEVQREIKRRGTEKDREKRLREMEEGIERG